MAFICVKANLLGLRCPGNQGVVKGRWFVSSAGVASLQGWEFLQCTISLFGPVAGSFGFCKLKWISIGRQVPDILKSKFQQYRTISKKKFEQTISSYSYIIAIYLGKKLFIKKSTMQNNQLTFLFQSQLQYLQFCLEQNRSFLMQKRTRSMKSMLVKKKKFKININFLDVLEFRTIRMFDFLSLNRASEISKNRFLLYNILC